MNNSGLKFNLALSTIYQVLSLIIPLITAPYVSRVLGVEGIGIYSYTNSYCMYFSLLAALGTVSYGTIEVAKHRNNLEKRSQVFWEIECLSILTSIVCIVFWGIWIFYNKEYRIYYMALTFVLLGTMFNISWLYAGMEEFRYTILLNCIFRILGAIAIFILVETKDDLFKYILIQSLTSLFASITMWIYLPRFIKLVDLRSLRLKKHFKETLVFFIPTIAISIYTVLDKTLIGLITQNASENGYYEQATKIVNVAKTITFTGVNSVMQSRIAYLFAENKLEEIKEKIALSMDYIIFVGFGLCFGVIAISPLFVPLFFGPGYDKTIILLQFLSPVVVIIGISNCLGSHYYSPAGFRARSAKFIVVGSIVNLILNLTFIPYFSSIGAVFATIVAETVISVLYLMKCDGFYSFKKLFRQMGKKILAGIAMLLIMLLMRYLFANVYIAVIMQCFVGSVMYITVLWLLKDSFIEVLLLPQIKKYLKF